MKPSKDIEQLEFEFNNLSSCAHYGKGTSYFEQQSYEQALSSFDEALILDSNDAELWHIRGITLARLNDYERAKESFSNAIQINPSYLPPWKNKIKLLQALEAKEELEALNELFKDVNATLTWIELSSKVKVLFKRDAFKFLCFTYYNELNYSDTHIARRVVLEYLTKELPENPFFFNDYITCLKVQFPHKAVSVLLNFINPEKALTTTIAIYFLKDMLSSYTQTHIPLSLKTICLFNLLTSNRFPIESEFKMQLKEVVNNAVKDFELSKIYFTLNTSKSSKPNSLSIS